MTFIVALSYSRDIECKGSCLVISLGCSFAARTIILVASPFQTISAVLEALSVHEQLCTGVQTAKRALQEQPLLAKPNDASLHSCFSASCCLSIHQPLEERRKRCRIQAVD